MFLRLCIFLIAIGIANAAFAQPQLPSAVNQIRANPIGAANAVSGFWPEAVLPMISNVDPGRDLQAFRRGLDSGNAVVVVIGDSTGTKNANGQIDYMSNFYGMVYNALLEQNRAAIAAGATITQYDRSIGGQTWGTLNGAVGGTGVTTGSSSSGGGNTTVNLVSAPSQAVNGGYVYGSGIGGGTYTSAASVVSVSGNTVVISGTYTISNATTLTFGPSTITNATWYSSWALPWLTTPAYVPNLSPDLVIIPMGTNDAGGQPSGISALSISGVLTKLANTANFPKTPSVIIVSNTGQTTNLTYSNANNQLGQETAKSVDRSIALTNAAGMTISALPPSVGLIDLGRVDTQMRLGYDNVIDFDQQTVANLVLPSPTYPYSFPPITNNCDFTTNFTFPSGYSALWQNSTTQYHMTLGSTIASGSQTPFLYFYKNGTNITHSLVAPGGTGSAITLNNITVSYGTGDITYNVSVKQSRVQITLTTTSGTTTIYDGPLTLSGGSCTPQLQVINGTNAPALTINSYTQGNVLSRLPPVPDYRAWSQDLIGPCSNTGGGNTNHLSSCGTAYLTRTALALTNLDAHAGGYMPLQQTGVTATGQSGSPGATFTGTISGTGLTVSGVTGTIAVGQIVYGGGATANTIITAGSGTSWTVYPSQSSSPTSSATPTALTGDLTVFSSVPSGSAALLQKQVPVGGTYERNFCVMNRDGTNSLLVYPWAGANIEAAAANVPVSVATGSSPCFQQVSATQIYQK